MKTRILLADIETSPIIGYSWQKYDTNIIKSVRDSQIICFGYKWLDEKNPHIIALPDFPKYKPGVVDDYRLMAKIWDILDQADIVVTHNGNAFDIKKINARLIAHGMKPPTPYKQIDTLKLARRIFKFDSNKLADLGPYLKAGDKLSTGGFELWEKCMAGDPESWRTMKKYNAQDVLLLEQVYLKLRAWDTNHPNLNVSEDTKLRCTRCLSEKLMRRGYAITKTGKRERFQCQECGSWMTGSHETSNLIIRGSA